MKKSSIVKKQSIKENWKPEWKPEFQIFKEGRTDELITMISIAGMPYDRNYKIRLHLYLGYLVFDMDGNQITSI